MKNRPLKLMLLSLYSVGFIIIVSVLTIFKFSKATVSDTFGTFCIECRVYEKVRGIGVYGFGLVYCNNQINDIIYNVDYDKIHEFQNHLRNNGFNTIADKVYVIEKSLKANQPKKYHDAIKEYVKEIELLDPKEKETFIHFLK